MTEKVRLSEVADALDMQFDDWTTVLDKDKGEIIQFQNTVFNLVDAGEIDEAFASEEPEHIVEAMIKIAEGKGNFVELPDQYDVGEYGIMEDFANSLDSGEAQDRLLTVMRGRGAFRRFKDTVFDLGIRDNWFEFRDAAIKEKARKWCEENGIEYED